MPERKALIPKHGGHCRLKSFQIAQLAYDEDFLRQRGLPLWSRDGPRRTALIARRCATADDVARWVREQDEEHGPRSLPPTPLSP